jgi:hypothetical protein
MMERKDSTTTAVENIANKQCNARENNKNNSLY